MAVAKDAASASSAGTGTLSWTHTPVGTPKGVLVFVMQDAATADQVSGATYGGVSMTEVSGSPNTYSAGCVVHAFFLGTGIPTGAQTVEVTVSGTNSKRAACYTVTAGADTEVVSTNTSINGASLAAPVTSTLALSSRTSFVAIGVGSGVGAVTSIGPIASWTADIEHDFGTHTGCAYSYDTIGSSDVTVGYTTTGADWGVAIAVAVSEVSGGGGGGGSRKIMTGMF